MSTDVDRSVTFRPDTTIGTLLRGSTPTTHRVRVAGRLAREADGPIRLVDGPESVDVEGEEVEAAYVEAAWAGVEADWNPSTRQLCGARLVFLRRPRMAPAAAGAAGLREASFLLEPRRLDAILLRSRLVRMIRAHLENLGFVEVQTPVLHEAAEACHVRQAETRSVDGGVLFIRTDPEEYLKRYLTAGVEAVFEISVNVRLEWPDDDHLQEFTSVECYRRFWTLDEAIGCCSDLVAGALNELRGTTVTVLHGRGVDLTPPFQVAAFRDLVLAYAGLDIDEYPVADALAQEVRSRR
jgi:hypothetical protein